MVTNYLIKTMGLGEQLTGDGVDELLTNVSFSLLVSAGCLFAFVWYL